jgi:hypothetical protein
LFVDDDSNNGLGTMHTNMGGADICWMPAPQPPTREVDAMSNVVYLRTRWRKRRRRPKKTPEQKAAKLKAEEIWKVIDDKHHKFIAAHRMAAGDVLRADKLLRNPLRKELVAEAREIGDLQDERSRLLDIYCGEEPAL